MKTKNLNIFENSKSFDVKNLLDEDYVKPPTYIENVGRIGLSFRTKY